jgi:hypothetical protein
MATRLNNWREAMQEYIVKVYDNRTEWFNKDGQRHREDGPAITWADGFKAWYFNDQLHRTDGPAIENADGDKTWWVNDKLHRIDGPAIENADGRKEWYIMGDRYTEAEYHEAIAPVKELTMPELEKLLGHKVKIKAER